MACTQLMAEQVPSNQERSGSLVKAQLENMA